MIEIRSTHPYGYRSGEWAILLGLRWKNNRLCFKVFFKERRKNMPSMDYWPVYDSSDPYEFRQVEDI